MLALASVTCTQQTMRIIHLPFGWRNLGNKYLEWCSFGRGSARRWWKGQESLTSRSLHLSAHPSTELCLIFLLFSCPFFCLSSVTCTGMWTPAQQKSVSPYATPWSGWSSLRTCLLVSRSLVLFVWKPMRWLISKCVNSQLSQLYHPWCPE